MRELNMLELAKLDRYKKTFGEMTCLGALDAAIEAERMCRLVGPLDISFEHFASKKHFLEDYAGLLERAAK